MASQAELPTEDRATAGTRGVLMEAAFALAGEIPLSDLTLRPLAERAGVSEARGKFVFLLITALDKGPLAAYLERRPNLEGYLVRSRPIGGHYRSSG